MHTHVHNYVSIASLPSFIRVMTKDHVLLKHQFRIASTTLQQQNGKNILQKDVL